MSATSSIDDLDLKQKTLDLIRRFEAKDIVEYDVVHTPKHVSVMLKFKKKKHPFFNDDDKLDSGEREARYWRSLLEGIDDKDTGSSKDDKVKVKDNPDKSKSKDDKVKAKNEPELYDIATPIIKNRLFLLVGIPGSGKSTCLAKAMDNYQNSDHVMKPIKYVKFQYMDKPFIHLGSPRSDSPGTDSLPRSHEPIKQFLNNVRLDGSREQIIVAEGQRMTSANLLTALSDHYDIFIIHLDCYKHIAADRVLSRGGREPYSELLVAKMASAINNVKKASPAGRFLTVDASIDNSDIVANAVRVLIRERII